MDLGTKLPLIMCIAIEYHCCYYLRILIGHSKAGPPTVSGEGCPEIPEERTGRCIYGNGATR